MSENVMDFVYEVFVGSLFERHVKEVYFEASLIMFISHRWLVWAVDNYYHDWCWSGLTKYLFFYTSTLFFKLII